MDPVTLVEVVCADCGTVVAEQDVYHRELPRSYTADCWVCDQRVQVDVTPSDMVAPHPRRRRAWQRMRRPGLTQLRARPVGSPPRQ